MKLKLDFKTCKAQYQLNKTSKRKRKRSQEPSMLGYSFCIHVN